MPESQNAPSPHLAAFKAFHTALLPFVFGKTPVAELFEIALLTHSHVLIEDFPGVGKTTIAKAFAKLLGLSYSRVQGTSDSLPQDILGGETYDFAAKNFVVRKGPAFEEVVLIDEINRMHPKTQSAFLQCMEEGSISVAGTTFTLPEFHFVIATENPIEYVGTYPLPEAQKDRFGCVISIGYPSDEIQKRVIATGAADRLAETLGALEPALTKETLRECMAAVRAVRVDDTVIDPLLSFVNWSRTDDRFRFGISPRGLNLFVAALKAKAYLSGRDFVIPEDGRDLAAPFLSHRVAPNESTLPASGLPWLLSQRYRDFLW